MKVIRRPERPFRPDLAGFGADLNESRVNGRPGRRLFSAEHGPGGAARRCAVTARPALRPAAQAPGLRHECFPAYWRPSRQSLCRAGGRPGQSRPARRLGRVPQDTGPWLCLRTPEPSRRGAGASAAALALSSSLPGPPLSRSQGCQRELGGAAGAICFCLADCGSRHTDAFSDATMSLTGGPHVSTTQKPAQEE